MNRYGSILSASYFTLLNLFGEFPLMDAHTTAGRYIGIFTAVVRVCFCIYSVILDFLWNLEMNKPESLVLSKV